MNEITTSRALRLAVFLFSATLFVGSSAAQEIAGETLKQERTEAVSTETRAQRDLRMAWWREAKFGLFIHWGVYAVPAGKHGTQTGYGEWIMHSAKIPVAEYRKFAEQFNPTKYNPADWMQIAADAGMRYVVITAKHHDGFALFPSQASSWNVADATPYRGDLLDPLVKAAHSKGLKIGFYYSQAQDWVNPGGAKSRFKEGEGWDAAQSSSFDEYLSSVAVPQVRELLTRYPIDILWWDTPTWMNKERAEPLAKLLSLRTAIISNNRLGGGFKGDTETPEQFVPITPYKGDWETCMTLNQHWGFNAADQNWKSSVELIQMLASICGKGGNFLLNVGPDAAGEFPDACVQRLRDVGRWLRVNGESIYGTKAGPFLNLSWGTATRKGNALYLHVFKWPADSLLKVPLESAVRGATMLTTRQKLEIVRESDRVVVRVPKDAPDAFDSVVVLELAEEPRCKALPSLGATVSATATDAATKPGNLLDGTQAKFWRAPAEVKQALIEVDLGSPKNVGGCGLEEPDVWPRLRQKFKLEVKDNGSWRELAQGSTVGHGIVKNFTPVVAQQFRISIERQEGAPGLAEVMLFPSE